VRTQLLGLGRTEEGKVMIMVIYIGIFTKNIHYLDDLMLSLRKKLF
jgi:hypothetical protein